MSSSKICPVERLLSLPLHEYEQLLPIQFGEDMFLSV